ncbi:MAG: 3-oxoacyl-ACP reductase [Gemmatimonadetes bacterium 13_2_20CM_69_27]|nr:MAG: 3-oxoacyl-ACP reductase [Gemmatimonadetes bacterium 13_2_20CM_69_27]OLB48816.1 MAG: 3-oxoacyl-ACP reductase [Gemmatimonadetes bacterium 13_2_20CM_2_69_23]OLD60062.1 MAG: 3-oxoacyl-ACP reductase [Gemmatimonadetes bacterium 13_1_20CM_69_28]PYO31608.1 MAG: 3-oxoacyl-ACP reductase [Gemmatimonadota bacterium]
MSHEPCRVAVITGGARGIGYATADVLARDGHAVVIADIDPGAGEDAAERLRAAGRSALSVPTDVADRASVEAMVRTLLERLGRIDVLVNNAGIAGRVAPLHEVTEQEWDTLIGIDLKSVYLCCRAVLPHMLERQRGAIINVASVAGKEGNPNMAPYSTAKAGIIGLTKAVAKEVAQRGVRVNAVAPATAETDILKTLSPEAIDYMKSRIPMGRFCRVEEIAEVIAFLASDKASFVTGQTYDVSGGRCTY